MGEEFILQGCGNLVKEGVGEFFVRPVEATEW